MNNRRIVTIVAMMVSIAVLCGCSNKNSESENMKESSYGAAVNENSLDTLKVDSDENCEESEEQNTKRNVVHPIKVNVTDGYNSTFETYDSISEIDLNRPNLPLNRVFLGWENTDLVNQIVDRTADVSSIINLSTISEDISNTDNVIFNDAIYSQMNEDYISVPVKLGGNINFAIADIEVSFDTGTLEFDCFENVDPDAVCNCSEKGKINISFVSTTNISAELYICDVKFKKVNNDAVETNLEYLVTDIAAWNDDFTDYVDVKHSIINSKIVIY